MMTLQQKIWAGVIVMVAMALATWGSRAYYSSKTSEAESSTVKELRVALKSSTDQAAKLTLQVDSLKSTVKSKDEQIRTNKHTDSQVDSVKLPDGTVSTRRRTVSDLNRDEDSRLYEESQESIRMLAEENSRLRFTVDRTQSENDVLYQKLATKDLERSGAAPHVAVLLGYDLGRFGDPAGPSWVDRLRAGLGWPIGNLTTGLDVVPGQAFKDDGSKNLWDRLQPQARAQLSF